MSSKLQSANSSRPTSRPQLPTSPKTPTAIKDIEKFISDSTADFENASNYDDLKLQAYRTAFDAIMEELKTYRPILAKIKEAYDQNLANSKDTKRELEQTRQALLVINENCEARLAEHTSKEMQRLKDANNEIKILNDSIKNFKSEKEDFKAQIDKLKIDLSSTYEQYRDERDSRKILVSELRATQATASDLQASFAMKSSAENQMDPVKLASQLDIAQKDLARANEELSRTKADYGDVVPRREYNEQTKLLEQTTNNFEKIKSDFDKIHKEHKTLLDLHQQISKEREDFSTEAALLRREATPRPQWSNIRAVWPEGSQDWRDVTEGKTSDQHVKIIADQFEKSVSMATIQILGDSSEVPIHLRWSGRNPNHPSINSVHNRNFERLEVSAWIDKIWKNKILADGRADPDVGFPKLSEIVLKSFQEEFSNCDPVVYEYTYSFNTALENLKDEPYIQVFKDILDGNLHDSCKYRFDWVIANARKAISATAAGTKNLNIDMIVDSLKDAFPIKEEEDFNEMRRELEDFENSYNLMENLKQEGSAASDEAPARKMVGGTPSLDKIQSELGKFQFLFSQDENGRYSNFLNS